MYEKLYAKLDLLLAKCDFSENQTDKSRQDPPEDIVTVNVPREETYQDNSPSLSHKYILHEPIDISVDWTEENFTKPLSRSTRSTTVML